MASGRKQGEKLPRRSCSRVKMALSLVCLSLERVFCKCVLLVPVHRPGMDKLRSLGLLLSLSPSETLLYQNRQLRNETRNGGGSHAGRSVIVPPAAHQCAAPPTTCAPGGVPFTSRTMPAT